MADHPQTIEGWPVEVLGLILRGLPSRLLRAGPSYYVYFELQQQVIGIHRCKGLAEIVAALFRRET